MTTHIVALQAVPACPICGSSQRRFMYDGVEHEYDNTTAQSFPFYCCGECTNVYLDPRPAESGLSIIYPPNYYSRAGNINASPASVNTKTVVGRVVYKMNVNRVTRNLTPYIVLGPEHRLLDIGCGSGRHLGGLHLATGCNVEGIDFDLRDDLIATYSRDPITLHKGDFFDYDFGDRRYDVVYAAHIIEHVANPVRFLQRIADLLKPGGICVLETPNEDCLGARIFGKYWGGNHIPRHWFIPSALAMERLVGRVGGGLSLQRISYIPITFSIWSMHALLQGLGFKKLADTFFPSDDRYVSSSLINVGRHGMSYAVSFAEKLLTGKSACLITVIRKQ